MKPITRYERYLAYLGSDEDANGIDYPVTRIEQYLSKIAGQDVPIPEKPILRIEQYLAKIAGQDVEIPEEPISRVEMYLAAIAGEDVDVPEPITREEWYLAQWAENGSGVLKTVSGAFVHITDALAKKPKELTADIPVAQEGDGDPAPDNIRPFIGYLGASVTQTGENIFDEATAYVYNRYLSYDNYNWKTSSSSRSYSIKCKPNTRYVISASNENITFFRAAYAKLESWTGSPDIPIFSYTARDDSGDLTVVTGEEAKRLVIQLNAAVIDNRSGNVTIREASKYAFAFPNKNLYDADKVISGLYVNETGDILKSEKSCFTEIIPVVAGETYTFSGIQAESSNTKRIHGYYNGAFQTQITSQTITVGEFAITFQIPNGINQIVISSYNTDTNRQLELGDTATEYEEQSVVCYGGTLDATTGILTIKYKIVDGGNQGWNKISNNNYRNFVFTWSAAEQNNNVSTVWSSQYKSVATNNGTTVDGDNYVWMRAASGSDSQWCCVKDTSKASMTEAQFKEAMTGVKFVALLREENWITYQLTPQQVKLFLGENNIWADTDSTLELTYLAEAI